MGILRKTLGMIVGHEKMSHCSYRFTNVRTPSIPELPELRSHHRWRPFFIIQAGLWWMIIQLFMDVI